MFKIISLPVYSEMAKTLANNADMTSPSEAHGVFCGLLCANPHNFKTPYLSLVTDDVVKNQLQQLFEITREQFNQSMENADSEFSLPLLLPTEDAPLAERIAALGQWAQGFLSGLGEGGLTPEVTEETTFEEVLQDMAMVARVHSVDQIDAASLTTEDEEDYNEIMDYIGVAVLSIYTDVLLLQQEGANDAG